MDLYFAGTAYKEVLEECKKLKVAKLFTNATERKNIIDFAKDENFKGKLMVDSGAFTTHTQGKEMNIDDYIDFLNKYDDGIDYFIQVDDIPGIWGQPKTEEQLRSSPIKSWNNYLYMLDKVKSPKKLLPVFHQGEDFKYLKNMVNFKYKDGSYIEYICISGNKELNSNQRSLWYDKCFEVIESSSNPNVKIHCLGCQSTKQLEKYPFTSADATSWVRTAAFGNIMTDYGNILISSRQENNFKNVINESEINLEVLNSFIKKFGFNLSQLSSDSEEGKANVNRMIFNLRYLKDWADNYKYLGPKSFIRKRLF